MLELKLIRFSKRKKEVKKNMKLSKKGKKELRS